MIRVEFVCQLLKDKHRENEKERKKCYNVRFLCAQDLSLIQFALFLFLFSPIFSKRYSISSTTTATTYKRRYIY